MLSQVIGLCLLLCIVGLWLIVASLNYCARRRDQQLLRLHNEVKVFDAHHAIDSLSIHAIRDMTRRARAELDASEVAMCKLFGVQRFDGSPLYDRIVNAVHGGNGWAELIAQYNWKHYGARWPASTRSAKTVV